MSEIQLLRIHGVYGREAEISELKKLIDDMQGNLHLLQTRERHYKTALEMYTTFTDNVRETIWRERVNQNSLSVLEGVQELRQWDDQSLVLIGKLKGLIHQYIGDDLNDAEAINALFVAVNGDPAARRADITIPHRFYSLSVGDEVKFHYEVSVLIQNEYTEPLTITKIQLDPCGDIDYELNHNSGWLFSRNEIEKT